MSHPNKKKHPSTPATSSTPAGPPAGVVESPAAVFCLGLHADFACQSCGRCCTQWNIAIDRQAHETLTAALLQGRLTPPAGRPADPAHCFLPSPASSADRAATIRMTDAGCNFLEPGPRGLCAVHRQLGPGALPWPCRLFPRLSVITPAGAWLTLSHYCPTVAAMLFREDLADADALRIVRNPPAFPLSFGYGGLDARRHAPPLLAPGVLLTWDAYAAWERHTMAFLAQPEYAPEDALIVLATTAEKLRRLKPAEAARPGPLLEILARDAELDPAPLREQLARLPFEAERSRRIYALLLDFITPGAPAIAPLQAAFTAAYGDAGLPDSSRRFELDIQRFVRPAWGGFQTPVRRWLAARLFANYAAYQGGGLRTGLFAAACALAALRVHATLACVREGRPLDRGLLTEAFSLTDYLIGHGCDRPRLIRFLGQIEQAPVMELIGPMKSA